jgi:Leucine-rich repeat (LRR) protein
VTLPLDLGDCAYGPEFEAAVRAKLSASSKTSVLELTDLRIETPLASIAGIECLENLATLRLGEESLEGDFAVIDLSPASGLEGLRSVYLGGLAFSHLEAVKRVTYLGLYSIELDSLEPLAEFSELQTLSLSDLAFSALPSLSKATALTIAFIGKMPVSDLTPLGNLPALEALYLEELEFLTFAGLSNLPLLERLDLRNLPFESFEGLADVPSLTSLDITDCPAVESLDGLEGCENLSSFSARPSSSISDLGALASMANLRDLTLPDSSVSDLAPVAQCPSLRGLWLPDSQVVDLSPLVGHPTLTHLDLAGNQLTDLTPLAGLALQNLNITANQVESIEPLSGMPLRYLAISANPIASLDPIATLGELTSLAMAEVGATSLDFLQGLTVGMLYARGNQISDVDWLVMPFVGLNLSDNQIVELPAGFVGAVGGCADTFLTGNPLDAAAEARLQELCDSTGEDNGYYWDGGECPPFCPIT